MKKNHKINTDYKNSSLNITPVSLYQIVIYQNNKLKEQRGISFLHVRTYDVVPLLWYPDNGCEYYSCY